MVSTRSSARRPPKPSPPTSASTQHILEPIVECPSTSSTVATAVTDDPPPTAPRRSPRIRLQHEVKGDVPPIQLTPSFATSQPTSPGRTRPAVSDVDDARDVLEKPPHEKKSRSFADDNSIQQRDGPSDSAKAKRKRRKKRSSQTKIDHGQPTVMNSEVRGQDEEEDVATQQPESTTDLLPRRPSDSRRETPYEVQTKNATETRPNHQQHVSDRRVKETLSNHRFPDNDEQKPKEKAKGKVPAINSAPKQHAQGAETAETASGSEDEGPEEVSAETAKQRVEEVTRVEMNAQKGAKRTRTRRRRRVRKRKIKTEELSETQDVHVQPEPAEPETDAQPDERLSPNAILNAAQALEEVESRKRAEQKAEKLRIQKRKIKKEKKTRIVGGVHVALATRPMDIVGGISKKGRQPAPSFYASCLHRGPKRVSGGQISKMLAGKRALEQ